MKKFLLSILGFILLLLPVMVIADYLFSRSFRKMTTPNMEIWKDVFEGKASADILVSGDSRVNTDFFPEVIDSITGHSVYDLSSIGHHYNIQRLRYQVYREFNQKPLLLVQSVDNWLLMRMIAKFDREQFLPWMWNRSFRRIVFDSEPTLFLTLVFPWFRYHGHRGYYFAERETEKGFYLKDRMLPFRRTRDGVPIGLAKDHRYTVRFNEDVDLMMEEGIKVLLVVPPMHESLIFMPGEKEKMIAYFKGFAEKKGIPFLDYNDMFSSDSTKFSDETHLNLEGARMFSDSLSNEILRLGLL